MYEKLLKIQMEIGAIKKDSTNPFFNSKYFDINALLEQVKPVLNKHGVVLIQGLTNLQGKLALSTRIFCSDRTADMIEEICPIPEGTDAQKTGSAITYFRRYALQSLSALEAEDDDGHEASKPVVKPIAKPVQTKSHVIEVAKRNWSKEESGEARKPLNDGLAF